MAVCCNRTAKCKGTLAQVDVINEERDVSEIELTVGVNITVVLAAKWFLAQIDSVNQARYIRQIDLSFRIAINVPGIPASIPAAA